MYTKSFSAISNSKSLHLVSFIVVSLLFVPAFSEGNVAEKNETQEAPQDLSANPSPPPGTDKSMKRISAVPLPRNPHKNANAMGALPKQLETNTSTRPFEKQPATNAWSFQKEASPLQKFPSPDAVAALAPMRKITLNGVNIGALRSEELKGVKVKIDAEGNIEIIAPQYEVSNQTNFHPLFPSELPKFQKEKISTSEMPQGKFSKDGSRVDSSEEKK